MYGYIYQIENNLNNKKYIGKHKCNVLNDSYMGSGKLLRRAQNKYGIENFSKTILEYCNNEEELNQREIYWINFYNAVSDNHYYNLQKGGTGGFDYINKNNLNNRTGFKWNKAQCLALSKIMSHPKSNLHKLHISESLIKNSSKKGINNPNFGKIYYTNGIEEIHIYPDQISYYESKGFWKGRPKSLAIKTTKSKDTYWYNNGIINKRIKQSDIDYYENLGFKKGRYNKGEIKNV